MFDGRWRTYVAMVEHTASLTVCTPVSSLGDLDGTCESTSSPCAGVFYKNLCPGPANVECCATSWGACSAAGVPGSCIVTTACKGSVHPGLCPGPANVECCVTGPSKYLRGIDVSSCMCETRPWDSKLLDRIFLSRSRKPELGSGNVIRHFVRVHESD